MLVIGRVRFVNRDAIIEEYGYEHKKPEKFQRKTTDILLNTIQQISEGITGVASSKRQELILSAGHILQSLTTGHFLSILSSEWKQYKDKGKIKDDYEYTEQHRVCLQELLNSLDEDTPDEIRFSILKKIFLVAATESVTDRNSHLPLQYMQIARRLSSGEIIVLSATYEIAKKKEWDKSKTHSAIDWLKKVAKESGLEYPELVETHESQLINKSLITIRLHSDRSGVALGQHFRLTDLGYALCNYIENYKE